MDDLADVGFFGLREKSITPCSSERCGITVELAVRDVVIGRPVKNLEALVNPEALEHFRVRPELG